MAYGVDSHLDPSEHAHPSSFFELDDGYVTRYQITEEEENEAEAEEKTLSRGKNPAS